MAGQESGPRENKLGRSAKGQTGRLLCSETLRIIIVSSAEAEEGASDRNKCIIFIAPAFVSIKNGTIVGSYNGEYHQNYFLGIPYAQPPLGSLQFNAPEPVNKAWVTARSASAYGPHCRNSPSMLPVFSQGVTYQRSEDCLALNIVQPSGLKSFSKLPVLVWIHGGGLQDGGSADPRYNMSFVVQESVEMGFLTIGIQANIHAFGRDCSRVTIQGEPSSAISVGHHLLANGGRDEGLFYAAIAESSCPLSSTGFLTLDQQDERYNQVLNAADCQDTEDTLGCLRMTPVDVLDDVFRQLRLYPVIDGSLVPDFPSISHRDGKFAMVPLLIGTNTNEGTAGLHRGVMGLDLVHGLSIATAGDLANELREQLGTVPISPRPGYGSLYGQTTLYIGHFDFNAGRRHAAQIWSRYGVPVYSYRFNIVPAGVSPEILGAAHFQEVAFVFKNFNGLGYAVNPFSSNSTEIEAQRKTLSTLMSLANVSLPWPTYSVGNGTNILFRAGSVTLEADNARSSGIARITQALGELRL
ncbi:alpha/beta-hydrolase [Zopfia rhizophila CBS 207.26]|uniref:Alpha/beta-hydrolase n=1 Tax=Zopfia rhizophila CBS 207.26 TaxID=1314779 RepID=A0A6A6DTJ8_9PEZI|nr:alpha/beta-hydrolase [Zopfia rhizophila CBS 207.26]